jgi:hypothetical protein
MVEARVTHPDEETTRVKIVLERSRHEEALGASLDALVSVTDDLEKLIRNPKSFAKSSKYSWYLVTTFHTPERRFVRERRFFERCARHPKLHECMLAYVRNVNARERIPALRTDFGHSDMRAAGCFAIVPLVLHDARYLPALIEHMRGTDMDHETFHEALIEELLKRHGLCEETLDLLAFRAVDGAGQAGGNNMKLAMSRHGLRELLAAPSGLERFAERVDRISRRKPGESWKTGAPNARGYREIYVANAGQSLFEGDPRSFSAWLAFFRTRGLAFGARDEALSAASKPRDPGAFADAWNDE